MSYKLPKQKKTPACRQCRQRKIGCDRAKPRCGNCVKRNRQDCIYPEKRYGSVETYHNMQNTHNTINHNVNYHNHTLIATPMISNGNILDHQTDLDIANNGSLNSITSQGFGSLPDNFNNYYYYNNNNTRINIPLQKYYGPLLNSTTGTHIPLQTKNIDQDSSVPPNYGAKSVTHQFNTISTKDTFKPQKDIEQADGFVLNENLLDVQETILNKRTARNNTTVNGNTTHLMDDVSQEIDNRVHLLNANLDSLPSLFNPTKVSNIYDTKYISTTYSHKNKKTQQNNKKSNELENFSASSQSAPVFYDLMTSIYSQEEILLKEMDFLRDRYIQLLYYKSKYSDEDPTASNVHKNIEPKLESNDGEEEQKTLKRRKIEKPDSDSILADKSTTSRHTIDNNKIPLTLLSPYDTLSISNDNAQNTKFPPTINNYLNITTLDLNLTNLKSEDQDSKLNRNFIILRDHYLTKFYEDLTKIMKTDFIPNLNEYSRSKFKVRNICNTISNCEYRDNHTFDYLKLLKVNLILEILEISCKTMPNANKIFYPILDFKISNWMVKVIKLLNDSIEISGDLIQISIKPMATKDLSFIGVVIIIILFFYYSNKFSLNRKRSMDEKRNSKPSYSKLIASIEQNRYVLFYSLFSIKKKLINEIVTKYNNENAIKSILKFVSLYELLDQIKYDNPMSIDNMDYNEDIMIALHFSINNIQTVKGKNLKSYWKFISNNYLRQKIFEGKIPIMFVNSLPSMNYYEDKKSYQYIGYSNEDVSDIDTYNFYVSQLKIINYLYMDDNETTGGRTISKLNELIKIMDDKYYKFMNLPRADRSFDLLDGRYDNYEFKGLQRIDNSLQYYKIKLHLEYLIFLQLEMVKEDKYIVNQFDKLFETVVVPIILLIFPSIHNDETKDDEETETENSNGNEDTNSIEIDGKLDPKNEDIGEDSEYEFKFIKRKMYLLEDLLDILYSIYERFQNCENYQRYKMNGGISGDDDDDDDDQSSDKSKVLSALNRNFKHLFIILYIILTSSPISDKFNHIENFRPVTKIFIILNRIGYEETIKSKLLPKQPLVKDKVTGLLSYDNDMIESKYMKITQQEYLTEIQNSNNGLRCITDLNSLGRYGKYLRSLNHKLIDICQLNHMTDLDAWFDTHIKSGDNDMDLSGYNISSQNLTKVFDVFFSST